MIILKLKLPLALLASILLCMNMSMAQDATDDTTTETTPTVTNPEDGGYTNGGTNCNIYISQNVNWTKDYNYDKLGPATLLSVGCHAGAGSLEIAENATVKVANCVFIGGPGYKYSASGLLPEGETLQSHTGSVSVGADATLEVGASPHLVNAAGSQLQVGSGTTGTLDVDGGTVITNYTLCVGAWSEGHVTVHNKGNVEVRLPGRIEDSSSSYFYVGYAGNGTVSLDDSSLSVTAENGRMSQTYIGLSGTGKLEVKNSSTADLGDMAVIGYQGSSSGTVVVDNATLTSGVTYVGYDGGKGELEVKNAGKVEIQGNLYINDTATVATAATLEVSGNTQVTGSLTVTDANMTVGGTLTNYGTVTVNLTNGGSFDVKDYVNHGTSTILASQGTTCKFGNLTLGEGMTLSGDGSFELGGATSESAGSEAGMTAFYVSGTSSTTDINFSKLTGAGFTIAEDANFTLNFEDAVLAGIAEGSSVSFELHLVLGNANYTMSDAALANLLEHTAYNVGGQSVAPMALAAEEGINYADFTVSNASYVVMDNAETGGKDLVWTGTLTNTVAAVPEPATATLSLLALAGLAARRRRK